MAWLLFLVFALGTAAVGLPFIFGVPDRWEYQIISPSDLRLTDELDRAGREGWEVISARRAMSGSDAAYELILKRRRSAFAFLGSSQTVVSNDTIDLTGVAPGDPVQRERDSLERVGDSLRAEARRQGKWKESSKP